MALKAKSETHDESFPRTPIWQSNSRKSQGDLWAQKWILPSSSFLANGKRSESSKEVVIHRSFSTYPSCFLEWKTICEKETFSQTNMKEEMATLSITKWKFLSKKWMEAKLWKCSFSDPAHVKSSERRGENRLGRCWISYTNLEFSATKSSPRTQQGSDWKKQKHSSTLKHDWK